jgi:hypothetical protein
MKQNMMKFGAISKRFSSSGLLMMAMLCSAFVIVLFMAPFKVQAEDPETEIAMWEEIVHMKQMEFSARQGLVEDFRLLCEMALIEAEQYDREIGLSFKDQVHFVRNILPEYHHTVVEGRPILLLVRVRTGIEGSELREEDAWVELVFPDNSVVLPYDVLLSYLGIDDLTRLRGQSGGRGR